MMADKSRGDISVYATLAVRAMALGTPTALAANAVDVPSKYMVRSGARVRQVDRISAPRADQPPKDVHDPFASMKPVKLGNHNMLNNRPSELIHTFVTDLSF